VAMVDSLYSINVCCARHYPLSEVGLCLTYATIQELDLLHSLDTVAIAPEDLYCFFIRIFLAYPPYFEKIIGGL
jgi:hypothetical protein